MRRRFKRFAEVRQEHTDLIGSIRAQKPAVDLSQPPDSSLVAVLGRIAANPFDSRGYDVALPEAATTLSGAEKLRLRHRFLLRACPERSVIEAAYADYAKTSRITWP